MNNACPASVIGTLAADLRAIVPLRAHAAGDGLPQPPDAARMADILGYIDAHLGECELDERMIRTAFNLSRATLYRAFQGLGGVARYIRERRLRLAYRHLQRNPACSLTWLLYEVGFASERQFQRAFQAQFGMSPARWRLACRSERRERLC